MAEITERQRELVEMVAKKVVKYRMTVPALLFLESVRPLNFIGSQALLMFQPFLGVLFNYQDLEVFSKFLEKRENMEVLMRAIEDEEANYKNKVSEAA